MLQDDAPPAAAVEAMAMAAGMLMATGMTPADAWRGIRDALPDADAWRLIAWLAQGREPTREMAKSGASAILRTWRAGTPLDAASVAAIRAMLAAAGETP